MFLELQVFRRVKSKMNFLCLGRSGESLIVRMVCWVWAWTRIWDMDAGMIVWIFHSWRGVWREDVDGLRRSSKKLVLIKTAGRIGMRPGSRPFVHWMIYIHFILEINFTTFVHFSLIFFWARASCTLGTRGFLTAKRGCSFYGRNAYSWA